MNHSYSQVEQALRDMLIHKAEGTSHDRLSRILSLPRPPGWVEADWVNAIHVLAFGARGHPRAVFRFLEHALARWHRRRVVEVQVGQRTRLYKGVDAFDDTHLGRFVRIGGPVYYSAEELNPGMTGRLYCTDGSRDSGGDWVNLVSVKTSENARPEEAAVTERRWATFLCFRVREAQTGITLSTSHLEDDREETLGAGRGNVCLYEVLLDPLQFPPLPPTYLKSAASALSSSAPLGGFLADSPLPNTAPHPFYIGNGRRLARLEARRDALLAAGVRMEIKLDRY